MNCSWYAIVSWFFKFFSTKFYDKQKRKMLRLVNLKSKVKNNLCLLEALDSKKKLKNYARWEMRKIHSNFQIFKVLFDKARKRNSFELFL